MQIGVRVSSLRCTSKVDRYCLLCNDVLVEERDAKIVKEAFFALRAAKRMEGREDQKPTLVLHFEIDQPE